MLGLYLSPTLFLGVSGAFFILVFFEWIIIPFYGSFISFSYSLLFLLVILGLGVYPLISSGVIRKSKYAFLGSVRSGGQVVSFEIIFTFLLIAIMLFFSGFELQIFIRVFFILLGFVYLISILVEISRAPFDFSEGERELVSGYNLEYRRLGFVFFFLKEYGRVLFFSVLSSFLFLNASLWGVFLLFSFFLYVRRSFPRFRYDLLISLFWFRLLPFSMLVFLVGWMITQ